MTDYYANFDNFYQRLEDWYLKHGVLIIAFDFDDTVFNSYGKPDATYDNVIAVLRRWRNHGKFVCFTARASIDYDFIKQHLVMKDIPFDYINNHANGDDIIGRKIYYNVMFEDKSGLEFPYRALSKLMDKIENGEIVYTI